MTSPIAIQLYSVREQLEQDFTATIEKIAQMGYVGVEPAGFSNISVADAAKLFQNLGLQVPSAHGALPLGEDRNRVLDEMAQLNCQRIVSGRGPDDFATIDKIKASCQIFNQAADAAEENGMIFAIHNHWWEYQKIQDRHVYQVMLENLQPNVFFEIDTYWVKTGGCDPVEIVKTIGNRAPLLHLKDGPCQTDQPMTALGQGTMNFPPIIQAAQETAQWLIVELDSCATDMIQAVKDSYTYLINNKLAIGNK